MLTRPDNIFLDDKANLKIGDFGVASLSQTNILLRSFKGTTTSRTSKRHLHYSRQTGTPLYTAPEQASGLFYNDRTDVFTLGIILFEMLSNFTTIHARIEKIVKLKDKGVLEDSFQSKFPCESKLILRLTERENDRRPSTSEITKLPEFEAWVMDLSQLLNLEETKSTMENSPESKRLVAPSRS